MQSPLPGPVARDSLPLGRLCLGREPGQTVDAPRVPLGAVLGHAVRAFLLGPQAEKVTLAGHFHDGDTPAARVADAGDVYRDDGSGARGEVPLPLRMLPHPEGTPSLDRVGERCGDGYRTN